jgi:hypothetical protein
MERLKDWNDKQLHLKRIKDGLESHKPILTVVMSSNDVPMFQYRCSLCALKVTDRGQETSRSWIKHSEIEEEYGSLEEAVEQAIDAYPWVSQTFDRLRKKSSFEIWGTYSEFLESEEWKALREKVKTRDSFRCRECRSRSDLQVHHLTYEHGWLCDEKYLITLCRECHERKHNDK